MDDAKVDRELRRYYESQTPSETRLATLIQVLDRGTPRVAPRPARGRLAMAFAACIAISAATGGLLVFTASRPPVPLRGTAQVSPAVDLIVVQMHADWCKPSQVMATRLTEVRSAQEHGNVLFIKLDLTDKERRQQAEYLMASLGYGSIWSSQRGVTGELLLIDSQQGIVLNTLTEADDVPQIMACLTEALRSSSGRG